MPCIQWLPVVLYFIPAQILFFGFISDLPLKKALRNLASDVRTEPSVLGKWFLTFALVAVLCCAGGDVVELCIFYGCEVPFAMYLAVVKAAGWF